MTRGRLVKKAEQEKLGKIQVDSYPWKDFSMETILLPDNPRKSVVLAKSHPEQELNRKVQQPAEFSRTFGNPSKPLFPEDMTSEYLASQEELRQRKDACNWTKMKQLPSSFWISTKPMCKRFGQTI